MTSIILAKATDSNATKDRTQNEDVFEENNPAQTSHVMEQSEMEISVRFNASNLSMEMSPKPCPDSFSTTKVLSTFRNSSLQRKYPKNATPQRMFFLLLLGFLRYCF